MLYLIRYSEIFLKSEQVRRRWINKLIRNIRRIVGDCKFRLERGRIWLITDRNVDDKLKKVFGIVSFSPCEHCKLDELEDFVLKFCKGKLESVRTFAVRVKRVGEHDFTSQDVERRLGALILKNFPHLKVDLENPEKTIYVEIRNEDCYVFDEIIKGVGGIPLGVEGKLVSLFSGGIDSPVATWLMMKRGCEVVPIYFDIRPFTSERAIERVEKVAKVLKEYDPDFDVIVKEHGNFLMKVKDILKEKRLESYTCIFCKRRMLKVAEEVAKDVGAKGIVTGDSLGQVASQTLDNLLVISQACSIPIYRPLIGFDKIEIEEIARKIGTFEYSTIPADCLAVPKRPTTKADLEKVLKIEEEFE
ncbi:tRNA uracil 4-sulfurtransferase ThiI [Archaeoglobus profundus]|uniref:Probable tRNA sulfurtransferase n=1 Tax=Archaeoglobus profundus (strain DSM 5631 / JCM 9629 / NBRC 100127 / Av18) TaxID=572546 RepID=D2RG35_ARCPA|nr:tRNA uracil 4-sulfurtransferase ThiI [Archaeoglobus profundus]ADB57260.1 thiamine biosynthesis/tRNA modification protein ThiI [Archaeoglobus profundus DSM 5631]